MSGNPTTSNAPLNGSLPSHAPAPLCVFRAEQTQAAPAEPQPPLLESPLPQTMVDAFAAATGWVIEFEESPRSCRYRVETNSAQPIGGKVAIVDMSATWPAKTPTAHRGHCDRFVAELNQMLQPLLTPEPASNVDRL